MTWRGSGPWASQAGGGGGGAGSAVPNEYTYRYAHWAFDEASGNLINAESNVFTVPAFSFAGTLGWSTPGAVTTAAGGNVMGKVVGDPVIDTIFRLDDLLTQQDYQVKLLAIRCRPNALAASAKRIYQYGDQGSAQQAGVPQRGGWVARFNASNATAPFTPHGATFAIHTPYNLALGDKTGGQSDENFADPIANDPVALQVGQTYDYVFAVDASRGDDLYYAMILRDAVLADEDVSVDAVNYPLPGISDVEINGSRGLRFFAQSDATGQAPLTDFTVWDIWVGEAKDTAHLMQIAASLHADSSANPFA